MRAAPAVARDLAYVLIALFAFVSALSLSTLAFATTRSDSTSAARSGTRRSRSGMGDRRTRRRRSPRSSRQPGAVPTFPDAARDALRICPGGSDDGLDGGPDRSSRRTLAVLASAIQGATRSPDFDPGHGRARLGTRRCSSSRSWRSRGAGGTLAPGRRRRRTRDRLEAVRLALLAWLLGTRRVSSSGHGSRGRQRSVIVVPWALIGFHGISSYPDLLRAAERVDVVDSSSMTTSWPGSCRPGAGESGGACRRSRDRGRGVRRRSSWRGSGPISLAVLAVILAADRLGDYYALLTGAARDRSAAFLRPLDGASALRRDPQAPRVSSWVHHSLKPGGLRRGRSHTTFPWLLGLQSRATWPTARTRARVLGRPCHRWQLALSTTRLSEAKPVSDHQPLVESDRHPRDLPTPPVTLHRRGRSAAGGTARARPVLAQRVGRGE